MGGGYTCCHADFPYGGTDQAGKLHRQGGGETIPECHSVGATHVERFQEQTELEKHESYTTGHTTAMTLVFSTVLGPSDEC